jgi:hypothetical protein
MRIKFRMEALIVEVTLDVQCVSTLLMWRSMQPCSEDVLGYRVNVLVCRSRVYIFVWSLFEIQHDRESLQRSILSTLFGNC